jgi:outer membrane protein assembly factor BamA
MMKLWALLLLLVAVQVYCVADSDSLSHRYDFPDSTLHVRSIFCTGNEVTKEHIILNEMSLKEGVLLTHEALDYDINRIYSLQLFNKVDILVVPTDSLADLIVTVNERWFFYPYPIAGLTDHSWSKLYYGLGVAHTNVGGINVQLYGQGVIGYNPFASLMYINPLFVRDMNVYLSAQVQYAETRNKSIVSQGTGSNFDEERFSLDVTIGKRLTLYSRVYVTAEYAQLSVTNNRAGRTMSADGTDRFPALSLGYRYDTRDLIEYPRYGTSFNLVASKIGTFGGVVDYERYTMDFRRFITAGEFAGFAGRLYGSVADGGTVPNYAHAFIGYADKIRGHYNTILEGDDMAMATVELHVPIISPRYIRFEEIPIEQFRTIRYAVYAALFADAGNVWYQRDQFCVNRTITGFGAGLHCLISYSMVVRFEYAIDAQTLQHREFILDLGAAL